MPHWLVRVECFLMGHRWVGDSRGTPVIPVFAVCVRCGKWQRFAR